MRAYRACSNDSGCTPALLLPTDPQAIVWNGLLHYKQSLDLIRDDYRRLDDEKRKREHG